MQESTSSVPSATKKIQPSPVSTDSIIVCNGFPFTLVAIYLGRKSAEAGMHPASL